MCSAPPRQGVVLEWASCAVAGGCAANRLNAAQTLRCVGVGAVAAASPTRQRTTALRHGHRVRIGLPYCILATLLYSSGFQMAVWSWKDLYQCSSLD